MKQAGREVFGLKMRNYLLLRHLTGHPTGSTFSILSAFKITPPMPRSAVFPSMRDGIRVPRALTAPGSLSTISW